MTYCKSTILGPLIQKCFGSCAGATARTPILWPHQPFLDKMITWNYARTRLTAREMWFGKVTAIWHLRVISQSHFIFVAFVNVRPTFMTKSEKLFQHTRPVERDISMCRSFRISLSWFVFQVAQDGGQSQEHRNCEGFVPVSPGSVTYTITSSWRKNSWKTYCIKFGFTAAGGMFSRYVGNLVAVFWELR